MENWTQRLLLRGAKIAAKAGLLATLFSASFALAQPGAVQVIEPDLDRSEHKPDAIDVENFEIGVFAGVISIEDFSSSEVYGVRFAYHVTEDIFLEANYAMAEGDLTSFEKLSGSSPLISDEDREYNYYNLNFGWNFLPGEIFIWDKYAFNSQLYAIVGVGSTEFAGDNWFTVNFGAGLRFLLTDTFAWHVDIRDHVFDRDTFGEEQTTHNIEMHTGITLFF